MDDRQRRIIERLGLNFKDFMPKTESDADRIAILEDAVIELAELLSEVE